MLCVLVADPLAVAVGVADGAIGRLLLRDAGMSTRQNAAVEDDPLGEVIESLTPHVPQLFAAARALTQLAESG